MPWRAVPARLLLKQQSAPWPALIVEPVLGEGGVPRRWLPPWLGLGLGLG